MVVHIIYDPTNPRGYAQIILQLVMLGLSWPIVIARFVARGLIRSIGLDDWLIIPAQVSYTAWIVSSLYFYQLIPGAQPASFEAAKEGTTFIMLQQALFPICTLFWKLSLGAFFLRIVVKPNLKIWIYVIMGVSAFANIFTFLWCLLMCGNPKDFFDNQVAKKCIPRTPQMIVAYTYVSLNALTDVAYAVTPYFLLKGSMLPTKVKSYVFGILAFATITVAASVARIWYVGNLFKYEVSYTGLSAVELVAVLELGTGIIAGSLVTLRPLQTIRESYRKFRSSFSRSWSSNRSEPKETMGDSNWSDPTSTKFTQDYKDYHIDTIRKDDPESVI